jgi:hypothetical protein
VLIPNRDREGAGKRVPKSERRKFTMTSIQPQALELLVKSSLKPICAAPGPFITIYLPAHHPGAPDGSSAMRLKTLIRNARLELEHRRYQGPIDRLLAPFDELAGDPAMVSGTSDSIIFGSPGIFRRLRLQTPLQERLVVATHPYITPLLADLAPDQEFYVLAINKKNLRLGRWIGGVCEEVPLPPSIPKGLEEFGGFDPPDHDLENRSAAGVSTGQMKAVHFGTGSGRETSPEYLHNYFRLVDRELASVLGNAPLVLIGVEYELAAYRAAAEYPRILEAPHTGPEYLTWPEMGERAKESLLAKQRGDAEYALNEFREVTRRDRVVNGIRAVLEAAREGRVHRLLLAKDAEHEDLLGPLYPVAPERLEGKQDLINAAAVETIRGRGEVYVLDPSQLGEAGPLAAILRYSRPK